MEEDEVSNMVAAMEVDIVAAMEMDIVADMDVGQHRGGQGLPTWRWIRWLT